MKFGERPGGAAPQSMKSAVSGDRGFTLIELLVVLAIIGMLAGIALPQLSLLAKRNELASQRASILFEINSLSYRAYSSGTAFELQTQGANSSPASSPIAMPENWRLELPVTIRYSSKGICSGGKVILISPEDTRDEISLSPPLCKVDQRALE